jgi:hypothetical protein
VFLLSKLNMMNMMLVVHIVAVVPGGKAAAR